MSRVSMLLDFLLKKNICTKGGAFYPTHGDNLSHLWGKTPPVWQSNLTYTFTAKSEYRVQTVLA